MKRTFVFVIALFAILSCKNNKIEKKDECIIHGQIASGYQIQYDDDSTVLLLPVVTPSGESKVFRCPLDPRLCMHQFHSMDSVTLRVKADGTAAVVF